MLKMNMEYKTGILFIRLKGNLNNNTSNTFMEYIMPVVNKYKVKYLVVNLNNISELDNIGFDTLITLKNIIKGNVLFIDKNNTNKVKLERIMALDMLYG